MKQLRLAETWYDYLPDSRFQIRFTGSTRVLIYLNGSWWLDEYFSSLEEAVSRIDHAIKTKSV